MTPPYFIPAIDNVLLSGGFLRYLLFILLTKYCFCKFFSKGILRKVRDCTGGFCQNNTYKQWLNLGLCTALGIYAIVMLTKPEIQNHILEVWAKKWNEQPNDPNQTNLK